jgi:hypothetical protein
MGWLRSLGTLWRSDDEIAMYVAGEVAEGRIDPAYAQHLEKNLRLESEGKAVIMRAPDPADAPRPPRQPGMQARKYHGAWWHY